ncbi:DedA family protein [Pseudalkalibacillus sp. SCS-8]|uniref:DedA family protein n=1 Tax=Pseudalkalibacillus nanhaiensis TaxID=3115291 RepID=UPI0032DB8085
MNFENVLHAIHTYGYWIILLTLFCGIVGIPAPEETFMVLIGMLAAQLHLMLSWTLFSAFAGTVLGLAVSYAIGRYLGVPFLQRYGRYIKITPELWEKVSDKFHRYGKTTLLFSLFIPGLRQIAPYVAGTSSYPVGIYTILSLIGSLLWTICYIMVGFWIGDRLPMHWIPWLSVLALLAFAGIFLIKKWRVKGGSKA